MENRFKESLLDKNVFSVTWELVPGRGAREKSIEEALEAAEAAAKGGKIHALTLTDNPGGNPAMLPDYLAVEVLKKGIEPLVHFTCKDRNRSQIESQLYALDRAGVRNLLVMTGDYPVSGYAGRPRPVFDLDPIHVLDLISQMNRGLEYKGIKGTVKHQPSDFFAGAVVSPFKATEAEQMVQYFKLKKKVKAGAQFIVTQLGYDARKFHEVILFIRQQGWDIPVVGNIYVLPLATARIMNKNKIPGCVVTDKLLAKLEEEAQSPDKGRQARLDRAAKMYAFMKGMGYDGVHIGGHNVKYEDVEYIIEKGEELSKNWMDFIHEFDFPIPGGFYYYEKDEKTGLNRPEPVNRKNRPLDAKVEFVYPLSILTHKLMLEPGAPLWGLMRGIAKRVDGTSLERPYHAFEHLTKVCLYDCHDCGDCALMDLAYVCPMSQCPKNQRNGACGGSYMGWCEVYPNEKKCAYVRAYARLKHYGRENELDGDIIPPPNWDLFQTSSWLNYYLGRDHSAKKLGIERVEKKKKDK
ncbi:Bifunctional homocysteine S-methyltransferase/5,10-methylenetetrahydrofolate reductase [Fervidicola ferrireducens]|uniref:Methylenetetrahydrofolate reductase n=1 Tax=Fervidicola ferrireducens TaxID=520764 RepID=A0A140L9M2_9FIRM|nr:Bifunctional homocysteine S-methyltransferase/5,10-methylenetetrahydrofolate reductase [Fervidicola ferrireducens]